MSRSQVMCLTVVLFCCALLTAVQISNAEDVRMVRLTDQVEINAAPADVWTKMMTGASLIVWCPYWKNEANAKATINNVGDVLEYSDEWGNTGKTVITFIDKAKELRMVHEPGDGSYVCHATLKLEAAGDKTVVSYVEQYTDESSPTDAKATAAKMGDQMKATLKSLKTTVEKS